jgi:hypothetical protein
LDRQIVYTQGLAQDTDILNTNKNALVGLGLLAQDILGTGTVVGGLPCTPTAPASLGVLIGPGRIYSMQNIDGTPYGSLPADVNDQILKQGIQLGNVTLATAAPATAGFSINYLVQAAYQDSDTNNVVLPFFNSNNPLGPSLNGQNNNGLPLPTKRQGLLVVQSKAGVPAATGTQVTPAPDAGFVGLYVVTVANGQASVTAANITQLQSAPFLQATLGNLTFSNAATNSLSTGPLVVLFENAAAVANEKMWSIVVNDSAAGGSSAFILQAATDVGAPVGRSAIALSRAGLSLSNVTFGNPTDNPVYTFNGTGLLTFPNAVTTAVAPAAGGAGALPATPAGYFSMSIDGVVRKIAFY